MIDLKKLKLVPETHSALYIPPEKFDFNGPISAQELADTLYEKINKYNAVGIAANQLGLPVSVFVISYEDFRLDVFNPTIIQTSDDTWEGEEACLSFPMVAVKVKRPKTVVATYQDVTGELRTVTLSNFTAKIFLHEYDHMVGMTMKQRVSPLKWDVASRKRRKLDIKLRRNENVATTRAQS
jgi:peptide deformylase